MATNAKKPAAETADDNTFNFEQALTDLNQLVNALEKGELSLEASLQTFEAGIKLTQQCQHALTSAERKIQILLEQDGKQHLEKFND